MKKDFTVPLRSGVGNVWRVGAKLLCCVMAEGQTATAAVIVGNHVFECITQHSGVDDLCLRLYSQ